MPAIRSSFNTSIKAGNQMLQVISSTSNTSETVKHTKNLCALVILMRWQRKLLSCSSKGDFKWLHSDSPNSLRPRQHFCSSQHHGAHQ